MSFTPLLLRLKLLQACDQWHASRVSTPLTSSHCKLRPNTEGTLAYTLARQEQLTRFQEGNQKRQQILRLFGEADKASKVLLAMLQDQKYGTLTSPQPPHPSLLVSVVPIILKDQ